MAESCINVCIFSCLCANVCMFVCMWVQMYICAEIKEKGPGYFYCTLSLSWQGKR